MRWPRALFRSTWLVFPIPIFRHHIREWFGWYSRLHRNFAYAYFQLPSERWGCKALKPLSRYSDIINRRHRDLTSTLSDTRIRLRMRHRCVVVQQCCIFPCRFAAHMPISLACRMDSAVIRQSASLQWRKASSQSIPYVFLKRVLLLRHNKARLTYVSERVNTLWQQVAKNS